MVRHTTIFIDYVFSLYTKVALVKELKLKILIQVWPGVTPQSFTRARHA
jgi:hypothetical protein